LADLLQPADEAELGAILADAAARKLPVTVAGGGTRAGLGRPVQSAATLSVARLSGITLYEPSELVISARAGTPLAEVEAALAGKGQRLAFEPIDHRPLYGSAGEPTIGGVVAVNASGPRRIAAGAARDALLGVRAVTGRGERVKSGGRVMKNVTGLDLARFAAGSHGTLAVLSEVTFKVLPAPETEATLVLPGLDDGRAVAALSAALGSPWSATGAAHVPADGREAARTLVRLEGFPASVAERFSKLAAALRPFGAALRLDGEASAAAWRDIRDLAALGAPADAVVWRVSVRPSAGPAVAEAARRAFDCRVLYDWGGGLVWTAGGEGPDAGASAIRAAVAAAGGGHAMLVRAADQVRLAIDVFEPQPPALAALTRRLKETFDPAGILNPGRMYPGV